MFWLTNRETHIRHIDKKIDLIISMITKSKEHSDTLLSHFHEMIIQINYDLGWNVETSRLVKLLGKFPFFNRKNSRHVSYDSPICSDTTAIFAFPYISKYDLPLGFSFTSYGTDMWSPLATGYFKEELEETVLVLRLMQLNAFRKFIDVGANIGFYSLLVSKHGYKAIDVIAFEPDDRNFLTFQMSIEDNELGQLIKLNKCAVGKDSGYKWLYLNKLGSGGHSLVPPVDNNKLEGDTDRNQVQTVSLDSLGLHKTTERLLIKIDVEGFEWDVLQGGYELLNSTNQPILFYEAFSKDDNHFRVNTHLQKFGYKIFAVNSLKDQNAHYISPSPLIDINNKLNFKSENANYFAFPGWALDYIPQINRQIDHRIFTNFTKVEKLDRFLDNILKSLENDK